MNHLTGKKITLLPFDYKVDFQYFVKLYKESNKIDLPELSTCKDDQELAMELGSLVKAKDIVIFVAARVFGNDLKKLGMVLLIRESDHKVKMINLIDEYFLRGLSKKFKKNDLTYSEDIINTTVEFLFKTKSIVRVYTNIHVKEKLKMMLLKRVGFEKEGVFKKHTKISNDLYDIALFAKIKGGL